MRGSPSAPRGSRFRTNSDVLADGTLPPQSLSPAIAALVQNLPHQPAIYARTYGPPCEVRLLVASQVRPRLQLHIRTSQLFYSYAFRSDCLRTLSCTSKYSITISHSVSVLFTLTRTVSLHFFMLILMIWDSATIAIHFLHKYKGIMSYNGLGICGAACDRFEDSSLTGVLRIKINNSANFLKKYVIYVMAVT